MKKRKKGEERKQRKAVINSQKPKKKKDTNITVMYCFHPDNYFDVKYIICLGFF